MSEETPIESYPVRPGDERAELQTTIALLPDEVKVRRTRGHYIGYLFGIVFTGSIFIFMLKGITASNLSSPFGVLIGLFVIVVFLTGLLSDSFQLRRSRDLLTIRDQPVPGSDSTTVISKQDVETIVVRENVGRWKNDDTQYRQLYLVIKEGLFPKLVFQRRYTIKGVREVEDLANALSARWNVPVHTEHYLSPEQEGRRLLGG